jgi:hypothetical protein
MAVMTTLAQAAAASKRRMYAAPCGCQATHRDGTWLIEHCNLHGEAQAGKLIANAEAALQLDLGKPKSIYKLWEGTPPERATILGKGPSLSAWCKQPFDCTGWTVFAVNEAITSNPWEMPLHVDYFVFSDIVAQTIANVPKDVVPIRPHGLKGHAKREGYWYRVGRDLQIDTTAMMGGTVGRAAQILGQWIRLHKAGPIDVLMVGCDSWDNNADWDHHTMYADCIRQTVGHGISDYTKVNRHLARVFEVYKAELRPYWFHREIAIGREYSQAV